MSHPRKPHSSRRGRSPRRIAAWCYIGVVIFFFTLPTFYAIMTAFQPRLVSLNPQPQWLFMPTLDNFRSLFENYNFLAPTLNSIQTSLLAAVIALVISAPAAYALSRARVSGAGVIGFWLLAARVIANFFDPHHPFAAPAEYMEMYPPGSIDPPVGGREELAAKPSRQTDASDSSYVGHGPSYVDFTPTELDEIRSIYYAMVSLVDDCVGKILAAVEENGSGRDTMIIFTSDHGEMLGDHALLLKGPMMYDVAVRVPLILSWPGQVPEGAELDGFVGLHDIARTLRVAASLPDYERDQGQDLVAMAASEHSGRNYAWCEYRDSCYPYDPPANTTMYRTRTHKLVVWHGDPDEGRSATGELYDLENDPDELVNLWDDPDAQGIRLQMYQELCDIQMKNEDRTGERVAPW